MNYLERRRAAWRAAFQLLGLVACVVAASALVGCTASQRSAVADFFGGFFSTAAPVADAAGQPWLGALLGWAGKALLNHPYESAGTAVAAAPVVKHFLLGGFPGTKKHRESKAISAAKRAAAQKARAQMKALDAEVEHRRVEEAAAAKISRAAAKKNAAMLAANQHATATKEGT